MFHLFISYSHKDKVITDRICRALAAKGVEIWIDRQSLQAGIDFESQILSAITEAEAFLFLFSENSGDLPNCHKEINFAIEHGKRIIVIRIDGVDKSKLPSPILEPLHWIDCRDGEDDFDTAINHILKAIYKDYEWVKYHTKLEVKALDWEQYKDSGRLLRGEELQEAKKLLIAVGSHKDPMPTDQQRRFISESRKTEQNRLRTAIGISTAVMLTICILCIITLVLRNVATQSVNARNTAQANEIVAQATATVALAREEQQTNIALSRKIASEAATIQDQPDLALLLSVLAYKVSPTFEAKRSMFTSLEENKYVATVLHGHTGQVDSLDFSSDEILSVGEDGKAFLWDMKSSSIDTILIDNNNSLFSATAVDPTNQTIAYARDREITLFNIKDKKELSAILPQEALNINCMVFTPDGNLLITGGGELGAFDRIGQIIFWNVNNSEQPNSLITLPYPARSIAISSTGKIVALGLEDISGEKALLLFDTFERKPIGEPIGNIISSAITSLAFSPDDKYLAVGSEAPGPASLGGAIGVLDMESLKYIGNPKTSSTAEVSALKFVRLSYGGVMLASNGGANGNMILLWNPMNDSEPSLQLKGHNSKVAQISISSDGKTLISGGMNGKIIVWDLSSLYFPRPLGNPLILEERLFGDTASNNQLISNLHFSSDGHYIVGIDAQSNPIAWDIETGNKTNSNGFTTLSQQANEVTSSTNKLRLIASENGIALIDTETNQEMGILPVRVQYLALSPAEDYVISYGYQSHAWMGEYPYLWSIHIGSWLSQACRMAGRNLTNEEWNKYLPGFPYQEICKPQSS